MNRISLCAFILSLSLMLSSCSDEPNAVGINLIPPNDAIKIDSLETTATFDTTFLFRTTGSSSKLLVGNYNNGTGQHLKARTLLQFSGFLSVPPGFQIDSAILRLTADYRFKDSTGILGFEVHEMVRPWNEATFTWDSSNSSGAFQTVADTSFLKAITPQDTVIRIRIDTLVRDWVRTSNNAPYGIILIPDSISTNIVLGFRNEDQATAPRLTIIYHDTSTSDSLVLLPTQTMFVGDGDIPVSTSLRYLQSGVAFRDLIRFDSLVSALPRNVIITQATLEVAADNSTSLLNSYSHDSLLVYFVKSNTAPYSSLALATVCQPGVNGAQKVFRSDIKNTVQQWVTNQPNYGIVLRAYNEFASFDRFALYGANAVASLRPKLKITYTILP